MFEAIFYRARESYLLINADRHILDANRAACRFLNTSREELIGMSADSLFSDAAMSALCSSAALIDSWTPAFGGRLAREDRSIDLRAIQLHPKSGARMFAIEVSQETSQRAIFRELRHELNKAIETARREKRTVRDLAFTNRKLDAFAHRVAHDIRGPLRNIRMAIELVGDISTIEDEELRSRLDLLEIAGSSAASLERLTVGLLSYSQNTSRAVTKEETDLTIVVEGAAHSLDLTDHDSWLSVKSLPVVMADETLLEVVFQNLLSNAVKFASADRPLAVSIETSGVGDHAEIYIRDNGIGFSPEARERIFELFSREHADREGAGIGLATCAELIAQHGWSIEANSAYDEGAEFKIIIPWDDVTKLR
ncbi:ATP-binding protein [Ponticaulis sp.]|uniref:sensor histidine kinase n=1 Tax=Ponticaulis sp. TaxID=2020902 RepID=UPI0025D40A3B|nr:ATP-binding protein [Ponticaulis sp.]|tara:strand:+ start:58515 stop:59615 length:1101 start_codon:yes stop_codon:yes gene_type:complete